MKTTEPTTEQPAKDLAELAREYRTAKDAADLARESVKPASKTALEARHALVAAMKTTGNPIVVDGRLYRIAGNGQFTEDDVQVLGG